MIDFGRMLTYAVARRVAFVLVALVFAWLGMGRAHAGTGVPERAGCTVTAGSGGVYAEATLCGSAERAYTYARQAMQQRIIDTGRVGATAFFANESNLGMGDYGYPGKRVTFWAKDPDGTVLNQGIWYAQRDYLTADACPSGQVWDSTNMVCKADCTVAATSTSSFNPINGSLSCDASHCEIVHMDNGDGTSTRYRTNQTCPNNDYNPFDNNCPTNYYYNGVTNVCSPKKPEVCPAGMTNIDGHCKKRQECPTGMHLGKADDCVPDSETCPAGQVKGPDGSCVGGSCPAGQVKGPDGTCKKDADGDGKPDANDGTFSGGDDCGAPPQCSGDAILCGSARIQWRIDCNTRKNVNVSGGACNAVPICTGEKCNAMEYAGLLQSWRTTCALEKMLKDGLPVTGAGGGGGPGGGNCPAGDANCNGVADVMESAVASAPDLPTVVADGEGTGAVWGQVNKSGFLGGGSCPGGIPEISWAGRSLDLNTTVCQQGGIFGNLIYLFGIVAAAGIIGKAASGA
jgi:hypothetical protein